ncbi:MAG: glucose-6-phosphate isomerase [Bacteroidota bacterium]|nr:glucose-6-phosphate isomerase [Bacteroidota bacterium]
MKNVEIDISQAIPFIEESRFGEMKEKVHSLYPVLLSRKGKGNDFLGWLNLPASVSPALLKDIREDAERIRSDSQFLVVIGIGGSYLGTRAIMDALSDPFSYLKNNKSLQILYAGHNLSEDYHASLMDVLDKYDYSVAVVSKSGTTTEPAVAFRMIHEHLVKKYGKKNAAERIIAITDASKGALKSQAIREGFRSYIIPDDVGGRYSVLSPVGLVPLAIAGISLENLLEGALSMRERLLRVPAGDDNPAIQYATVRNSLYRLGKTTEIMVSYRPDMYYFIEWWKQLFGESEGKEHKGIFPAGAGFTTDLHSMGQYIQEGLRMIFETVLSVEEPNRELRIPVEDNNADGLNFMAGKRISEINRMAELGTLLAHVDGGVPNIRIRIPSQKPEFLGQLIYFFEFSCALSGYTLEVNPFNQPGVEAYKKNMFALMGKPGYEKAGEEIRNRLR